MSSQRGFDQARDILANGMVKVAIVLVFWALAHHIFTGMRVLLIDIGIGVDREEARRSAWVVVVGSVAALLMVGGIILW